MRCSTLPGWGAVGGHLATAGTANDRRVKADNKSLRAQLNEVRNDGLGDRPVRSMRPSAFRYLNLSWAHSGSRACSDDVDARCTGGSAAA